MKIICTTEYPIVDSISVGYCNMPVDLDRVELSTGSFLKGSCDKCGQGYYKKCSPDIELK
jgi:hypothetical protein